MGFRIAIASADGKIVNEHFGRASRFLILESLNDGTFAFIEARETESACGGKSHSEESLERNAALLSDCEYVLVSQIGPGAECALLRRGITAFPVSLSIGDALHRLWEYKANIAGHARAKGE